MHGHHHLRARVRLSKGLEPFPARGAGKRALDYLMYVVGIAAPLALIPQINQLYLARNAENFSLTSWALLSVVSVLWGLYGVVHRETQIVLAHTLMFCFNLAMVVGILLYS